MKKESVLKNLFKYSGKFYLLEYLGMLLSAINAFLAVLPIIFIYLGIKEIFEIYPNIQLTDNLLKYAILTVGSAVLSILVYSVGLLFTHICAFRVARNMKEVSLNHLMKLPLGYLNEQGSGKLRRTISDSASQTELFLAHNLPDMVGAFTTPIIVLTLLFVFDWRLGLISLIPLVLSFVTMSLMMGKGYKEKVDKYYASIADMNNEAVEYVRGISVVKTFGQSVFSFKKFNKSITTYRDYVIDYSMSCRKSMVSFQTLLYSAAIFLLIGGIFLYNGDMSTKQLTLDFLFYIFFTPIFGLMMMRIMWSSQGMQVAQTAVKTIDELLSVEPLKYNNSLLPTNFNIKFENVDFSYPNSKNKALNNVSLEIKQGQVIGLVGTSGSGKSTIASLIARFYDVDSGVITIGNVDIKDISEVDLMNNISFVFQNTNLYKTTIANNVREGKPTATDEEVINALKLARCEDIINKLPEGINTVYGKGNYLSGGEAQRIAIARAILKDAPIVLLDEATAFTDPENEYLIQEAMSELAKNKTVVMIAHRLSTIKNANIIYVVENGEIIEHGTHDELISLNKKYNAMYIEYNNVFDWKGE